MTPTDAWVAEDPTLCSVCGLEACEDPAHLPPELDAPSETAPLEGRPVADRDDRLVETEYRRERARRLARQRLDREDAGPIVEPACFRLREWLREPDPVTPWRIAGWQPAESRVLLAAARKTGKTTFVASLVRSLLDGDLWLGAAAVTPMSGTVALLDTEMSTQLKRWYRDQGIVHDDRLAVFPLKGQAATLDFLDPACRTRWAAKLRAEDVRYLIVDNLRPILDALGLDESHEAGRWLVGFDALLREAAIPEACLVHHMGHNGERSRGDSRLRDWPDVEWRLLRQDEDDSSPRYIAAYGRDVDVSERQLAYDRATRRVTIAGGSRRQMKTQGALDAITDLLRTSANALSGRGIKEALASTSHGRDMIDAALVAGVQRGRLAVETGTRNAKLYRVSECPAVSGSPPGHSTPDRVSECPDDYRESDTPDTPPLPLAGREDSDAHPKKPDTQRAIKRQAARGARNTPRSRRAGGGSR